MVSPAGCTGLCGGGRTVHGGSFGADGWSAVAGPGQHPRLVYDLGEAVDCGSLTLRVSQFRPFAGDQFRCSPNHPWGQFAEFVGVFQQPHGVRNTAIGNNESLILLRYAPCLIWDSGDCHDIPDCAANPVTRDDVWYVYGICPGTEPWIDRPIDNVADGDYVFRVDWDGDRMEVFVNGASRGEADPPIFAHDCLPDASGPALRYLFVGHTEPGLSGSILGPVYSDLTVTECGPAPCDGHCDNGQQDCGEEGLDCGGDCARACDPEPPDAGPGPAADAGPGPPTDTGPTPSEDAGVAPRQDVGPESPNDSGSWPPDNGQAEPDLEGRDGDDSGRQAGSDSGSGGPAQEDGGGLAGHLESEQIGGGCACALGPSPATGSALAASLFAGACGLRRRGGR